MLSSVILVVNQTCIKPFKISKIYDQECLKSFTLLSKLPVMIQVSRKKCSCGSKKKLLSWRVPTRKVKSFLRSNFDQSLGCEIVVTQDCFTV